MPKIKTQPISLAPRTPALNIADPNPRQGRVTRGMGQRVFDSGEGILADIIGDVGSAAQSFFKYQAVKDKERNKTEASDYLADLENYYSQRYITDIATKRSGSAKDIFKKEVALTDEGKEVFLEQAGENKKLRDMLSIGYDAVTQGHLHNVSKHKLIQDEVYIRDTDYKVAKVLQTEMTNLRIDESKRAVAISNDIHSRLKDLPLLREEMKIQAWKGFYKFNARVNPDQTQEIYESPEARKIIVNQIGFKGYDSIQEAIDIGRKIKLQNELIAKVQAKEKKDKDIETVMGGAIRTYLKEPKKFDADLIDALKLSTGDDLPTPHKRILIGFLDSLAKGKILTDAEVDYSVYAELLEDVRRGKSSGLKIIDTQGKIIGSMNREITNTQGSALLKALSNRDMFDKPTIQAAFDKIENMYVKDEDFTQLEYLSLVQSLVNAVVEYDGDPKKVQEFMQDVLEPAARRGWWRKWRSKDPSEFEFQEPVMPHMSDQEEEAIKTILIEDKVTFKEGKRKGQPITLHDLTDEGINNYLEYLRSKQYVIDQNVKAERGKVKAKAKAKQTEQIPTLTQ